MTIGAHGDVRLRLRPDWHAESAAYVAALAASADACEDACEVYRVEPGFLVQGTLRSEKVEGNAKTRDGPRLMRRGDVGWAGEGPGPDFFVYLGREAGGALRHEAHGVRGGGGRRVDGDAGARGARAELDAGRTGDDAVHRRASEDLAAGVASVRGSRRARGVRESKTRRAAECKL